MCNKKDLPQVAHPLPLHLKHLSIIISKEEKKIRQMVLNSFSKKKEKKIIFCSRFIDFS